MHPFLADRGRLLASGAIAIPLAVAVGVFLRREGGLPTAPSIVVAAWLALSALGLLFPIWYLCRSMPLGETAMARLLSTHGAAAAATGVAWVYLGAGAARLFASVFADPRILSLYRAQLTSLAIGGGVLYLVGTAFHYMLMAEEAARRAERNAVALTVLAREAELRALKAQVHPHFLFNSLNSISALTASDPAKAREMCVLLSEFFRKSLAMGERATVALEEEWGLARTYLAIEGLRLGARLKVEEVRETPFEPHAIPPLILQPLVENAVRHGIATCPEGGVLRLSAAADDTALRLGIENPFDPEAPHRPGIGLGLTNVHQRLRAYYGESARLHQTKGDGTFAVEIVIPFQEKKK